MTNDDDISPFPPSGNFALWRALDAIYEHFQFAEQIASFRFREMKGDALPNHVVAAMRLLDCWLDIAIEEGWLEEAQ